MDRSPGAIRRQHEAGGIEAGANDVQINAPLLGTAPPTCGESATLPLTSSLGIMSTHNPASKLAATPNLYTSSAAWLPRAFGVVAEPAKGQLGFMPPPASTPRDLIHDISPRELEALIEPLVAANLQPLPLTAKQFMAVATLQGYLALPQVVDPEAMESLVARGHTELNRGLASSSGQPAAFYAGQFAAGPMYPGGVIVHGHGMYFAEPSLANPDNPRFPRVSEVAARYASKGADMGILLRCALRPSAKILDIEELLQDYKSDKNRAKKAGISDLGTYAAARGFDAFWIDEHFTYSRERTWNVVNRTCLILQRRSIRVLWTEAGS